MQHLSPNHYTSTWQHVSSPLATGHSNISPPIYLTQQDSPRGAKRTRSRSSNREDMEVTARRLRPTLPHLQTSLCASSILTPPLSSSSSQSSAGSSLASFTSFPRSFSMQNWQPSSTGLPPTFYSSPNEMSNSRSLRSSRGPQILGSAEMHNYANQGFSTPALCGDTINYTKRDSIPTSRIISSSTILPIAMKADRSTSLPAPSAPTLDAQQLELDLSDENQPWVEALVGTSMLAIESIWSSSTSQPEKSDKVLPLKYFIQETLRRSRSGVVVLQVALYYLHRARVLIRERVDQAEKAKARFSELSALRRAESERHLAEMGIPTPPGSPSEEFTRAASEVLALSRDPVVCGRRMFLASLICASKFLQDRNYSNRAWSKMSGLNVHEINANERSFLDVLGYELFIKPETFESWTARLQKLVNENKAKILCLSTATAPHRRESLKRADTEYLPAPQILDQPMGSLTSPSNAALLNRSSLSRSTTQTDLPRRASLATSNILPGSQQYSPLPAPRRSSDAYRHSLPLAARMDRRGSSLAFDATSHRPSISRRPSMSSEFRKQAVSSYNGLAIRAC